MTIVDSDTLTCSPNLYSEKGAHKNHLIVVNGASPRSDVYGQIPRNSLTWASWTSPKTHFSAPILDFQCPVWLSSSRIWTFNWTTSHRIPWLHGCFLYAKSWNVCWQVGDLWLGHSFFVNIRCSDSSGHFLGLFKMSTWWSHNGCWPPARFHLISSPSPSDLQSVTISSH